jgi:hypothetical protein
MRNVRSEKFECPEQEHKAADRMATAQPERTDWPLWDLFFAALTGCWLGILRTVFDRWEYVIVQLR